MPVGQTIDLLPFIEELAGDALVACERSFFLRMNDIEPAVVEGGLKPDRHKPVLPDQFPVFRDRPRSTAERQYTKTRFREGLFEISRLDLAKTFDRSGVDDLGDLFAFTRLDQGVQIEALAAEHRRQVQCATRFSDTHKSGQSDPDILLHQL